MISVCVAKEVQKWHGKALKNCGLARYISKYGISGIMGTVKQEILACSVSYDERTHTEILIVKYTLKAIEQLKTKGDFMSGMIDMKSPFCYAEV